MGDSLNNLQLFPTAENPPASPSVAEEEEDNILAADPKDTLYDP